MSLMKCLLNLHHKSVFMKLYVLDGYNGIVMAYGQTRIGKTFTLGQLGEEDTSDRGIMVCSMEDILADISLGIDFVTVSYLQLYMEALQDFLNPANDNIPIVEDPKTGDVSLSGDTSVEIKDQPSFLELLRVGETHRIAANTKLNTESSHSHAILTVHVKRFVVDCEDVVSTKNNDASHLTKPSKPIFRKSKLERASWLCEEYMLEKAKSINLSLSALAKCINALAENNSHVPFRDSKLTRLLRDSFGGTIRASLIVTISLSPYHQGETSNTILFGQKSYVMNLPPDNTHGRAKSTKEREKEKSITNGPRNTSVRKGSRVCLANSRLRDFV
ncbi:hypothetical protein JHK82_042998 [Glycine max]|nr:hypothetical protein JHK82_042998 [Glycine max]